MTASTPLSAAAHALNAVSNDFDEAYLRAWFTDTLGGTETPVTANDAPFVVLETVEVIRPGDDMDTGRLL